jgi:mono/diheme cytochrome c family protein
MKRLSGLLFVVATGFTGVCATRSLLPGDADRGRGVFRTQNCAVCHSINGEGGRTAPDLGQGVERGFSPYVMAGVLVGWEGGTECVRPIKKGPLGSRPG